MPSSSLLPFRFAASLAAAIGLAVAACNPGGGGDASVQFEPASAPASDMAMPAPSLAREAEFGAQAGRQDPPQVQVPSRLIRNGSMRIEVDDLDAAMEAATALVGDADGFVAQSQIREQGRDGGRVAEILLRVPAASFEAVVNDLGGLGRVVSESVSVTDVSREYFDLETRLAVREETVQRLRDLGERGGDLQELLAIERELGRAVEELESLKGQIVYYDRRIAESDLSLFLVEPGAVISDGAFRPVREALRDAAEVFARSLASLVYLVVFLVPWLVVAAVLFMGLRLVWKRRRDRRDPEGAS